jgi:radical SAM protein with 4Fe4S-binding SPASM domain
MAIRSNVHELPAVARFCRERTKDRFRFDPFLHLRYDRDARRNEEIRSERLTAQEIAHIETSDPERSVALGATCAAMQDTRAVQGSNSLFLCGAGTDGFVVGYDGFYRLCPSLYHPDAMIDLRSSRVAEAWGNLVERVRSWQTGSEVFVEKCSRCPIADLCIMCPAHAFLETGRADAWVSYFCEVAHARASTHHRTRQIVESWERTADEKLGTLIDA